MVSVGVLKWYFIPGGDGCTGETESTRLAECHQSVWGDGGLDGLRGRSV